MVAWGLANDIRRTFPGLGKVNVAHLWRGTLGRTVHRMPQIGEIERGLWLASGFGGHGLNNTAIAGELVARGIIEGDQTWRLFAPYELVWAGGVSVNGGAGHLLGDAAGGAHRRSSPVSRARAGAQGGFVC
jgi:glycine/D-amino acid oxidase-like deaminating enzyme